MKAWKELGSDNVSLRLLSQSSQVVKTRLYMAIQYIWEAEVVLADLKDPTIITAFKKGDLQICGNYHGISLFSIAGKISSRSMIDILEIVAA